VAARPEILRLNGMLAAMPDTLRGILLMCAGVSLFPLMNAMMKLLTQRYPVFEIVWARFTGHLVVMLIVFLPQYGRRLLATRRPLVQLASAGCYALYQIATRWVMAHDSPATGIIFAALLGSLATTLLLPFIFVMPRSLFDLAMFLSLGCLGGLGHFLVIKAFQAAPASVIAPLGYVELIGTATLGYLIFYNFPDALTWVGALIIIGSGLYIAMRERKRRGIR
jgi:drug/metabolite transporter (DMT)-like permease